ncbi:hypothetical protein [Actinocorallia longicatena]|uniref:Lipoprotein n=1 Tax=Actinocorallia longicatena TaxID=111803 RepID=A0ABP6PYT7_9ACTN
MRPFARAAALAAIVIMVGGGCADAGETTPPGETTLDYGGGLDLPPRLTFTKVENDSRCPTGVTCVWAGDATAVLSTDDQSYELHVNGDPRSFTINGRTVELLRLDPHPTQGTQIDPATYKATLKIT